MDMELVQRQGQVLSPRMIQAMEVLQMTSQELLTHLETVLQENPVLDMEEHHDAMGETEDLRRKLEWLESNDLQNRDYYRQDSPVDAPSLQNIGAIDDGEESLYQHLRAQLDLLELDEGTAACARLLMASLDGDGWLREDIISLAQEIHQPLNTMERALSMVQALEPAGVAARNLSECLCLQLLRRPTVNQLAVQIVKEHLNTMAKNQYGLLSRALNANQREICLACDLIRSLDPRPGAAFAVRENPVYITPDIVVINIADKFELLTNDSQFPSLTISSYYTRMLQESDDEQVLDYLSGKVRQAKWLIRAVEQRQSTLLSCGRCIIDLQADFFRFGPGHLKPMSLADIAQRVGVHESTVSRAINGKYLQCSKGTFSLNYFFSRQLGNTQGETAVSPGAAKALLKRLIAEEDKRHPQSDQKLCDRMVEEGYAVARRTVAKYREELGIPGASGRKQRS